MTAGAVLVAQCRARIENGKFACEYTTDPVNGMVAAVNLALDAFPAILDEHEPLTFAGSTTEGCRRCCGTWGLYPCPTVASIAAALGVPIPAGVLTDGGDQ